MSHNRGKGDVPMVRKDRQNKVCTSKGMKDRRIRLSANTAIQFYDLQDRLGCDRPSNAIDWLMKEAKVAIDALHSHHPLPASSSTTIFNPHSNAFHSDEKQTNWNQDCFNNYPFGYGVMNLKTEIENHRVIVPEEVNNLFSATPLDFNWNPNYNTGEGFASIGSRREPLQSSFLDPLVERTSNNINNVFGNDNGLMGFSNFQQDIQVQEDEENDDS